MPPIRPQAPPPDRGRTARTLGDAVAAPRVPPQISDLVRDVGGTRAAAQLVGRSERTIRRWSAGQVQHVPDVLRGRLVQAGETARTRNLIAELGGVRRVAELTGRSVRTVQRWAAGQISRPRLDARGLLARADTAVRMRQRGLRVDPATGRPLSPVSIQIRGNVRINVSRSRGYSYTGRNIGTPEQPLLIPDDVVEAIVDALSRSDYRAAHQTLEEHLSNNYAAAGGYDLQNNVGLFIDAIAQIEFVQDPPPQP